MTGLERIQVAENTKVLDRVKKMMLQDGDDSGSDIDEIIEDLAVLHDGIKEEIRRIEEVDPRIYLPPPKIERKYRTIASFEDSDIRKFFRFENKEQLQR